MKKMKKFFNEKQEVVTTNKNKKIFKKVLIAGVGLAALAAALAFGDEVGDWVEELLNPDNFDSDILTGSEIDIEHTGIGTSEGMVVGGYDVGLDNNMGSDGFVDKSNVSFGGAIDNSEEISRIEKEIKRQTKEVDFYKNEIGKFTEYTSNWYSTQCNNNLKDAMSKLQELQRDLGRLR